MANQGPDRRTVLEMLALAAVASRFDGFSRWQAGDHMHAHETAAAPAHDRAPYAPQFFTPDEYAALDTVTGIIIPADETPGAREAGVAEFIDFMAAHDPQIQGELRGAIQWLLARKFATAAPQAQEDLVRSMAQSKQTTAAFKLLRRYTVMGYYTSRIGLEELDYPGLKLYSSSPGCPHTNDREHHHAAEARS